MTDPTGTGTAKGTGTGVVGILANPMSGRDVRRLAARASRTTQESKREQIARAVIGAVAGGAKRVLVTPEPFRIATGAVENLRLDAEIEVLDIQVEVDAGDTERGALAMREAGCGALLVLGGDGTNRCVARAWPDAPVVPLSTGTNNVFPVMVEATMAGAAAGLVASGRVKLEEAARPAKAVHVRIDDEPDDLALVDAAFLVGDRVGNYLPVDPARIRRLVLARSEPAAVGVSAIGGMTCPAGADDEFGADVECVAHEDGGRVVLVPISPGLYRNVHVAAARRLDFGEDVAVKGPGILAFDGDRERTLAPGQVAHLCVRRDGPRVIDVGVTLRLASERGAFEDRGPWRDAFDGAWTKSSCC
ncbi:MAG: NAD(+)/NADH kinase [Deltaproteobacteria bacterium]|nr:NAD(+)/NADH kinase [Deltaproteobacteria bacterium]MBW2415587.1 NAD(+)/NADH kinase [Deltaproteobacteria bacterium]